MSCNYCRLPERNEPTFFDVLQKMIELNRLGVYMEISIDITNAFKVRLYSGNVEIVRYMPHYNAPFMESVIDAMLQDLKRGLDYEL